MLLKYLLVSILFYYIIKTSRNLIQAVRGELRPSQRSQRVDASSQRRRERSGWQGGGTGERRENVDGRVIEDAKWEDL